MDLPNEMIVYIIKFLPPEDKLNLRLVSRDMSRFIPDHEVRHLAKEVKIGQLFKSFVAKSSQLSFLWDMIDYQKLKYDQVSQSSLTETLNSLPFKCTYYFTLFLEYYSILFEERFPQIHLESYRNFIPHIIFKGLREYQEMSLWDVSTMTDYIVQNEIPYDGLFGIYDIWYSPNYRYLYDQYGQFSVTMVSFNFLIIYHWKYLVLEDINKIEDETLKKKRYSLCGIMEETDYRQEASDCIDAILIHNNLSRDNDPFETKLERFLDDIGKYLDREN